MNKQAEQIKTAVEETLAKTEVSAVSSSSISSVAVEVSGLFIPLKRSLKQKARLSKPVGTTAMNSSMPPQRISDPTR